MGVLYAGSLKASLLSHFTPASAYSFLVFVLLYPPCISAIATMKKEYGKNMALASIVYQSCLAWIVSFIVFNLIKIFNYKGVIYMLEISITIILAALAVYILYKNLKKQASGKCNCECCSNHCENYKK
jgi:cytochrome bd-type quinol oxidase subunit 2